MNIIVTSSWFTTLPAGYAPIGISRGVPRGRSGYRRCRSLEPGRWFASSGREEFTQLYNAQLAALSAERVVNQLLEMAAGRVPALLCWEPPEPGLSWCHRALVSVWLHETMGLVVPELGFESEGCGWAHPKLHPSIRRP